MTTNLIDDAVPMLSHRETVDLISTVGDTTTVVAFAPPGQAKTSMQHDLAARFPHLTPVHLDVPNTDIPDIGLRLPNKDTGLLDVFHTSLIPFDRPVLLVLDEVGKQLGGHMAPIFARIMNDRVVFDRPLFPGSIVWGTSNGLGEGCGDIIKPHIASRMMRVNKATVTAGEFQAWGVDNDIDPALLSWTQMEPQIFGDYRDPSQADNAFIFHPKHRPMGYACPRAVAKCNPLVRNRHMVSDNALRAGLAGMMGDVAARSLVHHLNLGASLPQPADIFANPMGVPVVDNPAGQLHTVFNLVHAVVTQDNLAAAAYYVQRAGRRELEAVLRKLATETKRLAPLARGNKALTDWALNNMALI